MQGWQDKEMASHSITAAPAQPTPALLEEWKRRKFDVVAEIPRQWDRLQSDAGEEERFRAEWLLKCAQLALAAQKVETAGRKGSGGSVQILVADPRK
jgi:hypothetical protein